MHLHSITVQYKILSVKNSAKNILVEKLAN